MSNKLFEDMDRPLSDIDVLRMNRRPIAQAWARDRQRQATAQARLRARGSHATTKVRVQWERTGRRFGLPIVDERGPTVYASAYWRFVAAYVGWIDNGVEVALRCIDETITDWS